MRVYILQANVNNYRTLMPIGQDVYKRYQDFNGEKLADPLDALPVQFAEDEKEIPIGDFPGLASHIPVFNQHGIQVLKELLVSVGEMLPLRCVSCEAEYVGMNVTNLVEALDESRSEVKRFKSSGRIMRILQYGFLEERLKGVTIFKLPETALKHVYVTERFVKRVEESELRGFVFKLIWTGGEPVILCPYCMGVIKEETEECPTCGLDTTRDAALEMTLEEMVGMKREPCRYCKTMVREWADPCPYCKKGKQRQGVREGVVIV